MNNSKAYLYGGVICLVTVLCIIILALEIPKFHMLLEARYFMSFMLTASVILGAVTAFFLSKKMSYVDKLRTYLIFIFFSFIPVLGIGSWLNRQSNNWNEETVELVDFEARIAGGYGVLEIDPENANQFVVTFKRGERLYQKVLSENPGYDFEEYPQNIVLRINDGLLGFPFVEFK